MCVYSILYYTIFSPKMEGKEDKFHGQKKTTHSCRKNCKMTGAEHVQTECLHQICRRGVRLSDKAHHFVYKFLLFCGN